MKKIIGILMALGLVIAWAVYAQENPEYYGFDNQDKSRKEESLCPKSLMKKDCLKCHTQPSFHLKEAPAGERYEYPNFYTSIVEKDGKKIGNYYVTEINSALVKDAFDYFEKHNISHIIIEIHCPGGALIDAWRIAGLMGEQEKKGKILETRCYGFAASAGFLVMISGSKGHRFVNTHAELMWHELWSFKMFDLASPSDKEEEARVLRHLQDTGNDWLSKRSNLTKEEIDGKVKKREFWMTGSEAVNLGFADGFLNK